MRPGIKPRMTKSYPTQVVDKTQAESGWAGRQGDPRQPVTP